MVDLEASMAACKARYESGNKRALFDAIFCCIGSYPQKSVPEWAVAAFMEAYGKIISAEARTYDEAFGTPWPKGRHLPELRKRLRRRYPIWHRVRILNAGDGEPIGDDLYRTVARELGIGVDEVRETYELLQRAGGNRSNLYRRHRRRPNVKP